MKNTVTTHLFSFFLLTLLLVKVSALHVYSHQDTPTDTIENCNICEAAVKNQQAEYVVFDNFTNNESSEPGYLSSKTPSLSVLEHTSFSLRFRLFGRPPPAIG